VAVGSAKQYRHGNGIFQPTRPVGSAHRAHRRVVEVTSLRSDNRSAGGPRERAAARYGKDKGTARSAGSLDDQRFRIEKVGAKRSWPDASIPGKRSAMTFRTIRKKKTSPTLCDVEPPITAKPLSPKRFLTVIRGPGKLI
jgi:hypothetical protein